MSTSLVENLTSVVAIDCAESRWLCHVSEMKFCDLAGMVGGSSEEKGCQRGG